jgi:hypothetical protein
MIETFVWRVVHRILVPTWVPDGHYRTGKQKLEPLLFILLGCRPARVELKKWRCLRKYSHHKLISTFRAGSQARNFSVHELESLERGLGIVAIVEQLLYDDRKSGVNVPGFKRMLGRGAWFLGVTKSAYRPGDPLEKLAANQPFSRFSRMLLKILSYVSWSPVAGRLISIRTVSPTFCSVKLPSPRDLRESC